MLLPMGFTSKNSKTCFQNLGEETRQSIWGVNQNLVLINSVEMAVRIWGGN